MKYNFYDANNDIVLAGEFLNPADVVKSYSNVVRYEVVRIFDLDEAIKSRIKYFKKMRDAKEQGGFEYNGKMFDSDAISSQRITLAALDAQASILLNEGEDFKEKWVCQDNSIYDIIDAEEMILISKTLKLHASKVHTIYNMIKYAISKATNQDEINAITWDSIASQLTKET